MTDPITPNQIDGVIHERVRLAIVSALAVSSEMTFNDLKQTLSLTDGNLSAHSRTLEEAGYIEIKKSFKGKMPLTTMRLTIKGRKAFEQYLHTLRRIVEQGDKSEAKKKR